MAPRVDIRFITPPQTLAGRLFAGLVAITLLVLGFFFVFFALAAAAVLVGVLWLRAWWRGRQAREAAGAGVIEGEYTVEKPARPQLDERPPQP